MSKVSLAGNASGTGIFTIASPNSNTDRTLTLPDNTGTVVTTGSTSAVTQAMLASNVVGNGPAFGVYLNTTQAISGSTWTKVQFSTEEFDTNSNFDTSTYRFTPTVAGYYQINLSIFNSASNYGSIFFAAIYKNGASFKESALNFNGGTAGATPVNVVNLQVSALVYLNGSTDYVEGYGNSNYSNSPTFVGGQRSTYFNGFLARAA